MFLVLLPVSVQHVPRHSLGVVRLEDLHGREPLLREPAVANVERVCVIVRAQQRGERDRFGDDTHGNVRSREVPVLLVVQSLAQEVAQEHTRVRSVVAVSPVPGTRLARDARDPERTSVARGRNTPRRGGAERGRGRGARLARVRRDAGGWGTASRARVARGREQREHPPPRERPRRGRHRARAPDSE